MKHLSMAALLALMATLAACQSKSYGPWPRTPMQGTQREYTCIHLGAEDTKPDLASAQGLDQPVWAKAPWSEAFLDIEGPDKPAPRQRTWVKMLWDDTYLYVAALLEETDVWATFAKRDMVVFHENDFEVFIDPDGDGEGYYEVEVNAKGTIFDLYLHKAYRSGGPALQQWNAEGIEGVVRVQGTLNDGRDRDRSWTVEMRIPWACLKPPGEAPKEGAERARGAQRPLNGQTWRMNFSRVQWQVAWQGDSYEKVPGTREDNWVWTPQWAVDMHRPEHWGRVHFTGRGH